jgi:hypothetical protein
MPWLAFSDCGGSLGKWVMKLEVRDHGNLSECSAWASFARNLPIIATALPHKLHQALLGMDRQQYREAHSAVVLAVEGFAVGSEDFSKSPFSARIRNGKKRESMRANLLPDTVPTVEWTPFSTGLKRVR